MLDGFRVGLEDSTVVFHFEGVLCNGFCTSVVFAILRSVILMSNVALLSNFLIDSNTYFHFIFLIYLKHFVPDDVKLGCVRNIATYNKTGAC